MAAGGAPADAEYLKEKGVEKLLKELTTELMKSRPKVRTRGGLRTPQRGTSAAGWAPPHCGHPRHANGVLHARCWRASRHTARAIRTTHACSLVRGQLDPSGQRAPAGCCGHLRRAFGMPGRGVLGCAGWKIAASGKRGGPGAQAACGCTRTLLARGSGGRAWLALGTWQRCAGSVQGGRSVCEREAGLYHCRRCLRWPARSHRVRCQAAEQDSRGPGSRRYEGVYPRTRKWQAVNR